MQEETTGFLKAAITVCEKNNITYWCQAGTVLGAIRHSGPIPWDEDADIIIPNNQINKFVDCCTKQLPHEYWIDYYTVNPQGYRIFPRIGKRGYPTTHLHLDIFRLIGLPEDPNRQAEIAEKGIQYEKQSIFYARNTIKKIRMILSPLRNRQPKEFFNRIELFTCGEKDFMEKMEDLCDQYPFDTAPYVMNPCGKYGKKNIFHKSVYGPGKIVPYLGFFVRVPSETDVYLRQYYGDYGKFPPQKEIDKIMNQKYKID